MKNGDKVKIKNELSVFNGWQGTLYIDDNGKCEVYIEETNEHSGFYIYCTKRDIIYV